MYSVFKLCHPSVTRVRTYGIYICTVPPINTICSWETYKICYFSSRDINGMIFLIYSWDILGTYINGIVRISIATTRPPSYVC